MISIRISKNYAFDFVVFHKVRGFKDGITFVEFIINTDWYKGDHNLKFKIHLIFLNTTIFELEVYNVNHTEEYGNR